MSYLSRTGDPPSVHWRRGPPRTMAVAWDPYEGTVNAVVMPPLMGNDEAVTKPESSLAR